MPLSDVIQLELSKIEREKIDDDIVVAYRLLEHVRDTLYMRLRGVIVEARRNQTTSTPEWSHLERVIQNIYEGEIALEQLMKL